MEDPVHMVLGGGVVYRGRGGAAEQLVDGLHHRQHLRAGDAPVAVHVVQREHPGQLLLDRAASHAGENVQELLKEEVELYVE